MISVSAATKVANFSAGITSLPTRAELSELLSESNWRASMAKAVCSEALRDAVSANVQIHGGIGFTWEDPAHLYFRRARTDEVMLGSPAQHWDRLSALINP